MLNHVGLLWRTDIDLWFGRGWRAYLAVVVAGLVLALARVTLEPSVVITVVLVAGTSLVLVFVHRDSLRLASTFPELSRVPLLGSLLSRERRP